MKSRYVFLLFFGFLIFLTYNVQSQEIKKTIVLEATIQGIYNFPISHNAHKPPYYYLLGLNITNNSDEIVDFLTFTCTPMNNVITDSKEYKICSPICPGNSIVPITLKPEQKFSISILLETYLVNLYDSIKIGWIYLNYENTKDGDDFFMKLDQAHVNHCNVIWSKEISIDKFYNEQIEIQ